MALPTEHSWDPAMPEYSDPDSVFLVTLATAFAALLAILGAVVGYALGKGARIAFAGLLVLCVYRLAVVLPHFSG
ncbi:hypothetical protein [Nonomuraea typhae]|uniref:Uncharacterized protein n=1 Tax=Nonomuraea typhae TaxID=2603600 RepID=A0ABW7YUA4_9ACTN